MVTLRSILEFIVGNAVKPYRLFISHSWNHSDDYDRLIRLLKERRYFSFKDYSIPRDDPIHKAGTDAQLRAAIRRQMAQCSVVLIPAGVYVAYSKWINIEIELAKSASKPIVAILPRGRKKTSAQARQAADQIVGWNTDCVVNAIKELA